MDHILLFCANCTWEIIPMLLGAWILGSLFWWLLRGTNLVSQVNQLKEAEASLQEKNTALQLDLDSHRYNLNKEENMHKDLKQRYGSLELKLRATEEQLRELKGD